LANFRQQGELKRATLAFIAGNLVNKTEKKELEKIFRTMDTDGNGTLSRDEVL
jgi:Ca2+-binding EF-hand superfamily protein